MRIWSVLAQSPPYQALGGAELQMHSLHKGLTQRGVDVHVIADICRVGRSFQIYDGIPIWGIRFPHYGIRGFMLSYVSWPAIKKLVLTKLPQPDLIHATMFREPAILASKLAELLNVPWTIRLAGSGKNGDFHYSNKRWFLRNKMSFLAKRVARVVALDESTYTEACAAGISPERIEIIQNGVSLSRRGAKHYHHNFGTSNPFTIVYAGRLAALKRIDTLLRSVKVFVGKKPNVNLKVIIAGDGPEKEHLVELAKNLGIETLCKFTGRLSSIEKVLLEADCFVNPSESEGLPNAVLEGLYCGVPVLLSDIPVHRKLAADIGIDRFCFQVGDHFGLSEALLRFADLAMNEKNAISANCYKYGERFSCSKRDERYFSLFSEVIHRQSIVRY